MITRVLAASLIALTVACGSSGPATVTPTTTVSPTITVAPSTTVAPTTTEPAATTTAAPVPTGQGLLWMSAVDPTRVNTTSAQPVGDADGVSSRIDGVVIVPASGNTDFSKGCADEVAFQVKYAGNTPSSECLVVQWSFDVAADFRVDDNSPKAGLTPGDLVTADGKQIGKAVITSAYPGTVANVITEYYAGAGAGSIVRWQTGSNLAGWTTFKYVVPTLDQIPPIYFG